MTPGGSAKMRKTLLCMALVLTTTAVAPSQSEACVDVAIVFAIDGSDSITDEEYGFEKRRSSAHYEMNLSCRS